MSWSSRAGGRPRRLLIVAAAAIIPVLAGCEAGDSAPTLHWHYPTEGVGNQIGGISIRNTFVLGAPGSGKLPAGQPASLFFAMVNNGRPDRLLGIQAPGTASSVTLRGGSIELGTEQAVLLTGPTPRAVLNDLSRPLTDGSNVNITLIFAKAGRLRFRVPVIPANQGYATFSPAPTPAPSRPAHQHHAGTATPTPSPTATS